jgi:hypothetical protein
MSEIKNTSYTQSQKDSIYRYRQKNRDKINSQAKKDYEKTKVNPEQLEKRRAYAKKYYQQKKEKLEKEYWENMYREFIVSTD